MLDHPPSRNPNAVERLSSEMVIARASLARRGIELADAVQAPVEPAPSPEVALENTLPPTPVSLDRAFLESQRALLIEERALLVGLTDQWAKSDNRAMSTIGREAVTEVDRALAKIERGDYGICELSGEPIAKDRLEAIPWTRDVISLPGPPGPVALCHQYHRSR